MSLDFVFVSGTVLGASSVLLAHSYADEQACARSVADQLRSASGANHDATSGECSAVFGALTIVADPAGRVRSCYLYPASGQPRICTLEPRACDSVPQELGGSPLTGTNLALPGRSLGGTVPSELGLMTTLQSLDLSQNVLSGTLPSQLGRLTRLHTLLLHSNSVSGSVPSQLGSLTRLRSLHLRDNKLSGALPTELALVSPTWCYLSNSQWASSDGGGATQDDGNSFDCPIPRLSAACGMDGLAFAAASRYAGHPGRNCVEPGVIAPTNAYMSAAHAVH